MDGKSLPIEKEKIKALKEILPEVFTEDKIDWEKLRAALGEHVNFSNERYVLNWAGKSDAFKVLQSPSTKTLIPAKEESVNFETTQNIFIEGENLEVLKVLQKSYFGKVKMIYIDPPYNTGNDSFIYPDKFSETKTDYEKRVGDKDEEGYMTKDGMFKKNSRENGQYHSNWLNMMMPRLYLAKNLLKRDGVIFVSIDDNEVHNLRLLMNEIFGEENFVAEIIWQRTFAAKNDAKYLSTEHEYILLFAKQITEIEIFSLDRTEKQDKRYANPDHDPRGPWTSTDLLRMEHRDNSVYTIKAPSGKEWTPHKGTSWRHPENEMNDLIKNNEVFFGADGNAKPRRKRFLKDVKQGIVAQTIWKHSDVGHTQEAKQNLNKLFEGNPTFDTPKPIKLLRRLLKISTKPNDNDIILDFFGGSGSIAESVIEDNFKTIGNRKYVCVQLPELCDEKSDAYKSGYKTIAEISKERIRRAGRKIQKEIQEEIHKIEIEIKNLEGELPTGETKTEIGNMRRKIQKLQSQDLGFKVLKLEDSNFKQWKQIEGNDPKALAEQIQLFVDPVNESATVENMVYELLLKSGKELNSDVQKDGDVYWINDRELALLLDKATEEIIRKVIAAKPTKVIVLDRVFSDNDQLKTNTVLQMRDAGIEFKTI